MIFDNADVEKTVRGMRAVIDGQHDAYRREERERNAPGRVPGARLLIQRGANGWDIITKDGVTFDDSPSAVMWLIREWLAE